MHVNVGQVLAERMRKQYLRDGSNRVLGWLDKRSAKAIAVLGQYQLENNIRGAVGEIGVHHGKLFILLHLLRRPDEKSFAIDLFDDQEMNVDQSGRGDFHIFARNIARFSDGMHSVSVFKRNSMSMDPGEILDACGTVRLMSIDGGHTAACTENDLDIASSILTENGIVVVDDYFNFMWPDVSIGVARFILKSGTVLKPFAISPNKLFLARPEFHQRYRDALTESIPEYFLKTSAMFDNTVDIFGYDPSSSRRLRIANFIKRSRLGPHLKYMRHFQRKYFSRSKSK